MNILSERENKFIQMIYDYTGGDVSQIVAGDLYPLAESNGFYHPEITSIVMMLRGLGYLEKRGYKGVIDEKPVGLMIACARLTSAGALYARNLSETDTQGLSGGLKEGKPPSVQDLQNVFDCLSSTHVDEGEMVEHLKTEAKDSQIDDCLKVVGVTTTNIQTVIEDFSIFLANLDTYGSRGIEKLTADATKPSSERRSHWERLDKEIDMQRKEISNSIQDELDQKAKEQAERDTLPKTDVNWNRIAAIGVVLTVIISLIALALQYFKII